MVELGAAPMNAATTSPLNYLIGAEIRQQSRHGPRSYVLAGSRPYITRAGRDSLILEWTGRCATCGCLFVCTSGRVPGYLNRNCSAHVQRRRGGAQS